MRRKEQNYSPFFYEDVRYPRIASNPSNNRKLTQREGYDGLGEGDRWGTYGLFRPRVLLKVNGDEPPTHIWEFKVRIVLGWLSGQFLGLTRFCFE